MKKLKSLLDYRKRKTPGYGISDQFYLSVLSPTPHLPTLVQVLNPAGEGAVPGFLAPLSGAGKDVLAQPLARGQYVASSLDKKSILKMVVLPKEEAGFSPEAFLRHPSSAHLSEDMRQSISATWLLIQLSVSAHDPMVSSTMHFMLSLASHLARLTGGVVADPMAQDYLSADQTLPKFNPEDVMPASQVIKVSTPKPGYSCTHGMLKFALPELEISGFSEPLTGASQLLLLGTAQTIFNHGPLVVGAKIGDSRASFSVVSGGFDRARWDGIPVLDLLPDQTAQVDEAIAAAIASA